MSVLTSGIFFPFQIHSVCFGLNFEDFLASRCVTDTLRSTRAELSPPCCCLCAIERPKPKFAFFTPPSHTNTHTLREALDLDLN